MKKQAFTMAEALLTMVILGVIATILIANIKPVQYRNEGFKVTAKKIYAELDDILSALQITCTSDLTFAKVYNNCDVKSATDVHAFGSLASDATELKKYMKTLNDNGCDSALPSGYVTNSMFKLKNGACIALKANTIWIDVNDKQGPNSNDLDIIILTVGNEGFSNPPAYLTK